jgi:hypothetical protein
LAFFSKTNVTITFFAKTSSSLSKKRQYLLIPGIIFKPSIHPLERHMYSYAKTAPFLVKLFRSGKKYSSSGKTIPVLAKLFQFWQNYSSSGKTIPVLAKLFQFWQNDAKTKNLPR